MGGSSINREKNFRAKGKIFTLINNFAHLMCRNPLTLLARHGIPGIGPLEWQADDAGLQAAQSYDDSAAI